MIEFQEDEHYGVGPVESGGDHSVLIVSTAYDDRWDDGDEKRAFICLDCGLVTDDQRLFVVTECDREDNPIPGTLREKIEKEGEL